MRNILCVAFASLLMAAPSISSADKIDLEILSVSTVPIFSGVGRDGIFYATDRGFGGYRFGLNYYFGEKRGFLAGATYANDHNKYFDCRVAHPCPGYKSDSEYYGLTGGYYWQPAEEARLVGFTTLGNGTFKFQHDGEDMGAYSANGLVIDAGFKFQYIPKLLDLRIPLSVGLGYFRRFQSNFYYAGNEFDGAYFNEGLYFILGLGVEF